MSAIRSSQAVSLHTYTPRVLRGMDSFENLSFYSVPSLPALSRPPFLTPSISDKLNLFAGQLYLEDFEAYLRICDFLGIYTGDGTMDGTSENSMTLAPEKIQSDGFVQPEYRVNTLMAKSTSPFRQSPVPFLRQLFSLRRKGNTFDSTHMGKVLNGRPLLIDQDFKQE